MPNICAVWNCPGRDLVGISFHRFPKDGRQKKRWAELCRRPRRITPSSRICSLHFRDSDYERNLMYELLGKPMPRNQLKLKNGAVPTLNLPAEGACEGTCGYVCIVCFICMYLCFSRQFSLNYIVHLLQN